MSRINILTIYKLREEHKTEGTNKTEEKADRYNNNVMLIRVMKRQTVMEKRCFAQWKSEEDGQHGKHKDIYTTQERETERNWTEPEKRRGKELKGKEFAGWRRQK